MDLSRAADLLNNLQARSGVLIGPVLAEAVLGGSSHELADCSDGVRAALKMHIRALDGDALLS